MTRIQLGHRRNIQRYRQLPATSLTELEREYIAKRLMEEQLVIETLSATMLPHLLEDPVVSSRIRVQPDRQSCFVKISFFRRGKLHETKLVCPRTPKRMAPNMGARHNRAGS